MPGASEEYLDARERLRVAERALCNQREEVAAMRRTLPAGPQVPDYVFLDGDKRVRLSELFSAGKPHLVVYHLMYWADDDEFCPLCSMWVDGLDGVAHHIEQLTNIVVATRAPVDKLRTWAQRRGWRRIRLLSDEDASFARDISAAAENGDPIETVAVFSKDGATLRHVYTAHATELGEPVRGIDLLSPVWHVFDLLPSGRDDWNPSNDYA